MSKLASYPQAMAQRDFHAGGSLSNNKYPKGSHEYREYEREMNRLLNIAKTQSGLKELIEEYAHD